jgi:hypothetical protein
MLSDKSVASRFSNFDRQSDIYLVNSKIFIGNYRQQRTNVYFVLQSLMCGSQQLIARPRPRPWPRPRLRPRLRPSSWSPLWGSCWIAITRVSQIDRYQRENRRNWSADEIHRNPEISRIRIFSSRNHIKKSKISMDLRIFGGWLGLIFNDQWTSDRLDTYLLMCMICQQFVAHPIWHTYSGYWPCSNLLKFEELEIEMEMETKSDWTIWNMINSPWFHHLVIIQDHRPYKIQMRQNWDITNNI